MSSLHPLVEGVADACHSGDVGTLQAMLTQYPELDINLSTEGGVTLLMHAIIGAGGRSHPFTHRYTCVDAHVHTWHLPVSYTFSMISILQYTGFWGAV